MASAALGDELRCSICLNLYKEPVSLRCGHNFCRDCIVIALDTQAGSGVYSCPECRAKYVKRPTLEKNRKLCNIADNFILCTYCVDSPPPAAAVKSCLQCETSMCVKHLTAHNNSVVHVLIEPTTSFSSRKCSIHQKMLEFYCPEDAVCLCVSCCLVPPHKGHQVEILEGALGKKKDKLRNDLEKMIIKREKAEQKIQNLQDQKTKAEEKADDEKKRVTALFEDIRRQLEVQEQRALSEISMQVEEISLSFTNLIKEWEIQKDELSKNISHIEKLFNMTNPITVLQDQELNEGDQNVEEYSIHNLDTFMISLVVHRSITDLLTNLQLQTPFNIQDARDLLLDIKTASNFVLLSSDLRTAADDAEEIDKPSLLQRFKTYNQVMSMESISHGRHYWEVEVGDCGNWEVGVCYPSIERDGAESGIGSNDKSWSFCVDIEYAVQHDCQKQVVYLNSPVQRLGLYLDYEGGRLSFYQLSEPIRHLHTFTTTFTEPLHAAFYLNRAWVKLVSPLFPIKP